MKVIKKEDLILILAIMDCKDFDSDDLRLILEKYGDEYFIEDGRFVCGKQNELLAVVKSMVR